MVSNIPVITPQLIEYLTAVYPDKAPDINWSDREVWLHRGEVQVVRHLTRLLQEQKDNLLGNLPVLPKDN